MDCEVMNDEVAPRLDKLDKAIHELLIDTVRQFQRLDWSDDFYASIEAMGGVEAVLAAQHAHSISALMGALIETEVPDSLIRAQTQKFKDSFAETIDLALAELIRHNGLRNPFDPNADLREELLQ